MMSFSLSLNQECVQRMELRQVSFFICPVCKGETWPLPGAIHVNARGNKSLFYICRNGHGTCDPVRRRAERRLPALASQPDCCAPTCALPFDLT